MVQTKGSKSLLVSDNQMPRPQDSGRDMAEGTCVGQVPQALGPGEELLQMCAPVPNAGDPCCTSGSGLSQCWGFSQFQMQPSTCMAIPCCVASTQRTAGRYCRNFAFCIYLGLL